MRNCSRFDTDLPFVNLPEAEKGRWGTGLVAEDMKKCVWVRPELVAWIEYLEWTDGDHLRHAKFAAFREDKDARSVAKECYKNFTENEP